ncbi:MAG: phenylalanine--tRNA ligase subunit alpha [Candidatus Brocadiae bacterium]|nr:phenylalanine--tRNA ligase subunit alpha [Candidatus Brocadiia bacterium]
MQDALARLRDETLAQIEAAIRLDEIEAARVAVLGRKGSLKQAMRQLKDVAPDERPAMGQLANEVKTAIVEALDARRKLIERAETQATDAAFDITLPGIHRPLGHEHPLRRTEAELREVFARLGFEVAEGPEVELEYYNFEALNIPADHPARDGFDTFYIEGDVVLRSHTSPVQIRVMEQRQPPIRVVVPGRVYRPDTPDATHSPVFHQIEGLVVGEGVTFADLKAVLTMAMRELFGPDTATRFRPSFFPFTEPSAEVDVSYAVNGEKRWLELLGAGMVHPKVFEAVGYDAERYTGFAFGMGIDRVAMLKYGIPDIRLFFENDVRFLEQF